MTEFCQAQAQRKKEAFLEQCDGSRRVAITR